MERSRIRRLAASSALFCQTALALFAIFILLIGPIADEHFAERQINHQHVYSGYVSGDHVHGYELPHSHTRPNPAAEAGRDNVDSSQENATVSITSKTGLDSFPQVLTSALPPLATFRKLADGGAFPRHPEDDSLPSSASVVPPTRPPNS
jgi:hypothetical protein